MDKNIVFTLVVGNVVYKKGLLGEHGLSIWIKIDEMNYLFDTGQGISILHNLELLDLDINHLNGVIVSHGHYDHAGGLSKLLQINNGLNIYGHSEIFCPKYTLKKDQYQNTGFGLRFEDINSFKDVRRFTELANNMWLLTGVPFSNSFEKVNSSFFVDKGNGLQPDNMDDELSLLLETPKGLVIISGCSHRGIINLLTHVKQVTGNKNIYAVIGGLHLINAEQERIVKTLEYFEKEMIEYIFPLHCTGDAFIHGLRNRINDKVKIISVGDKVQI